ncbi:MAG: SIR2 family protein [Chloroflexi bacterium]|nr:SIR2 family protein [Chloroflexota bacterium]
MTDTLSDPKFTDDGDSVVVDAKDEVRDEERKRVAYLFGAGATQACVSRAPTRHRVLMQDLSPALALELHQLVGKEPFNHESLQDLVNTVINNETDFEHIITFLDNAPSSLHREFAGKMKIAFEEVLRKRLEQIREDVGHDPIELYTVLMDLHNVREYPESLHAVLTTNYDEYIEAAIEAVFKKEPDFGITVEAPAPRLPSNDSNSHPELIKLHGSLGWQDTLPISRPKTVADTLWIPPGIQKSKHHYPFNLLWGRAHEVLHCDILRIVGCRLAANDWDLISLLFSVRHATMATGPRIEIIDSPAHVEDLKGLYPYLDIHSMIEVEPLGSRIMTEVNIRPVRAYRDLQPAHQKKMIKLTSEHGNWFDLWLTQSVEHANENFSSIETDSRIVEHFLGR